MIPELNLILFATTSKLLFATLNAVNTTKDRFRLIKSKLCHYVALLFLKVTYYKIKAFQALELVPMTDCSKSANQPDMISNISPVSSEAELGLLLSFTILSILFPILFNPFFYC